MISMKTLRTIAAATLLFAPLPGWSVFDPVNDDTDIFLANPQFEVTRPNVLIFLDNTANWNTAFDVEKLALKNFVNGLTSSYNVGFAMYVETGGANDMIDGGYIRYAIRRMTDTNRTALAGMVNLLDKLGDKGNNATVSLAMGEMYRYFAGLPAYSGFGKAKRDYAGNTTNNPSAADLPRNAFTSAASTQYVSPIIDGCQKNFVVFISNGPAGDNSSSLAISQEHLAGLVGTNPPPTIPINPSGEQGVWGDEYAKFMSNSDCNPTFDGVQNVYTYTIEVLPSTAGQGPSSTALLQSMATNGKGKYFAITDISSTAQIENALNSIFQEVQAVNSVFASTTLPVSVNVRGTNLNQVYIGVFRPDANKLPRWLGNLKLYKLGVDTATSSLFLADATGAPAENPATGFITGNAVSYWTAPSTYWSFRDPGLNGIGGSSDRPDGDLVEKGGAAQQIRIAYPSSQSTRKLYTCVNDALTGACDGGSLLADMPFDNTKVTAADVAAFTSYGVTSLTSVGTTATLILGAAPNPTWSAGNEIRVEGASPSLYNGTYTLASADNTTFTYTYTLSTAPDNSAAQARATNHGLQTGDLVTITGAGSFDVTDASVSRVDANNFRYSVSANGSVSSGISASGKKQVTSLTGSANSATAVVPGHGYATGNTVTISGAEPAAFNKTATITVVDADSFSYSTSPDVITGSTDTAKAVAPAHNLSTGQTVRIRGNSITSYNTQVSVTKLDANSFTFESSEVLTGAGGVVGLAVTNFSHPVTGSQSDRDVLTVTTETPHNITGPFPYSITIAGATGAFAVYNGTWSIASVSDIIDTRRFRITNSTFDAGEVGNPGSGVIAGKPITSIGPVVSASGTILSSKAVSVSSITALTNATGTITAGRTADSNNTLRDLIIAWVRGADNKENENPNTTPAGSDIRPSVHGDVLHSRPAVVNYNRYGDDNDIYAFYGANDGIFRALKGGVAAHTSGPDTALVPGSERWGFIPREFFGKLKRLRNQSPAISATSEKDYFADGAIGVYQKDARGNGSAASPLDCDPDDTAGCSSATVTGVIGDNVHPTKGDKVYLYLSMRRGGDFIYALDVTNPAAPKVLWRKSSADTGWEQVGMTWSEPKVAKLQADLGNANNPDNVVLIFGAGYDDAVEDINPCLLQEANTTQVIRKAIGSGIITYTAAGSCTITSPSGGTTTSSRTKGRGILVVDAFNGSVVWQAGGALTTTSTAGARKLRVADMTCAIASDTTVLDKNRDGYADRIYVGDTCGQLWRVDIARADMNEWTVTKVAAISSSTDSDIANKRKFLFPPDLVFGTDAIGNYTAVLMGSGDREHPFDTTVINRFYMFKDRDSSDPSNPQAGATNSTSVKISGFATAPTGSPLADSAVFDATNAALVDGTDPLGQNGWKITLAGGEKVISSPISVGGTTFFNTNQPSATAGGGACGANLGIARQYLIGFADAAATVDVNGAGGITLQDRSTIHEGGGYLPSPVPVIVEIDNKRYEAVISGTSVQKPPGTTLEARTRIYWYKEVE